MIIKMILFYFFQEFCRAKKIEEKFLYNIISYEAYIIVNCCCEELKACALELSKMQNWG